MRTSSMAKAGFEQHRQQAQREKAVRHGGAERGPAAARTGSTWIHWWSPVAWANRSMRCLVHQHPVAAPISWPTRRLQVGQVA
jgi:hypothetical protein